MAAESGTDAIHPGYGFLVKNPEFAKRCAGAGLIFIGPSPEYMALVDDKATARKAAGRAGVPGSPAPVEDAVAALEIGRELRFPIMLKDTSGGAGEGMCKVDCEDDPESIVRAASSEATSALGMGVSTWTRRSKPHATSRSRFSPTRTKG